ncbi:copper amine oxidase N-terminal domain-containing protein [Paenibacillus sp. OK003]|uniref:copper amine oxidase N-terminal domain-containing protein n=1 Tax=Paenibacillus sp. OK003 TaxID=1884380 RepID=UPI0008D33FE2|nr:copper amine oxidase N-terminal domain-containing protein [Paenibacillus sp. OK003]SEK49562.1 Copper amine oxidase N-terminal domain-containing protein [Paenibacillus sp. OK003]
MKTIRIKSIVVLMLFSLMFGTSVHASEGFFWSGAEPRPSCTNNTRDGSTGKMGLVIDGKEIDLDLPSCDEAMKNRVSVLVDGNYLHAVAGSGVEPFIENGQTMIPLRAVADAFGFEVKWEQSEGKITLEKDSRNIIMHIGKKEMLVDGNKVDLKGVAPMVRGKVTFLPVRQLAETLGIKVGWSSKTRTATFTQE